SKSAASPRFNRRTSSHGHGRLPSGRRRPRSKLNSRLTAPALASKSSIADGTRDRSCRSRARAIPTDGASSWCDLPRERTTRDTSELVESRFLTLTKGETNMKLHIAPPSPRAIKVVALKNNLGLECEIRVLNFSTGDHLTPEFAALNPNKLMPVLEDDGFVLWESNAILQYLAAKKPDRGLWPSDAKRQSDVLRWMSWEGAHWASSACGI